MNELIEEEAKAADAKAQLSAILSNITVKAPDHWTVKGLKIVERHLYYQHEEIIKLKKEIKFQENQIEELTKWGED